MENVRSMTYHIVDIDQLNTDEVFIHIKDGDHEYKGIIDRSNK